MNAGRKGHITRRRLIDVIADGGSRDEQADRVGFSDASGIRRLLRDNGLSSRPLPCGVQLVTSRKAPKGTT